MDLPTKAVSVGAGREFTIVVDDQGDIYSMGCPQYGQLGNGTDGQSLERAGKYSYANETTPIRLASFKVQYPDAKAVEVHCGANHSLVADDQRRLYTWYVFCVCLVGWNTF